MLNKIIVKLIEEYIRTYYDLDVRITYIKNEKYKIFVKHYYMYYSEYVKVYESPNLQWLLFNSEEQDKLNNRINEFITFLK